MGEVMSGLRKSVTRSVISSLAALLVCGCASMKPPERLYDPEVEFTAIRSDVDTDMAALKTMTKKAARLKRNDIIAARKYAIDIQYTKYETDLTREAQISDFGTKAASIALGSTAELIPVTQTKNLLN